MNEIQVKDLVIIHDDEPMVGTWTIAQGFNRDHHDITELLEKYEENFLGFKPRKSSENFSGLKPRKSIPTRKLKSTGGRPIVEYLLNEQQTAFLGTLFRNNKQVVTFKETLVRQFYVLKEELFLLDKMKVSSLWIDTRDTGKIKRLEATDRVKEFVEYANNQGSKNANYYYVNITKMMNVALFIVTGKFKNLRDLMTPQQLMVIGAAEGIIDKTLRDNMRKNTYYKDIYKLLKERLLLFAELHGQSEIMLKQLEE